jgi:REP element-mobilizing transposase RayT
MFEAHPKPLAYFITFTCYGAWLHGRDAGSVDNRHNEFATPWLPPDPELEKRMHERLDQPPYLMDEPRRRLILSSIQEVCAYRGWRLLALHVRSNHVHAVVQSEAAPERIMNDFKSYASRALNQHKMDEEGRKRWTRHGSTVYLWTVERVEDAIQLTGREVRWKSFRAATVRERKP